MNTTELFNFRFVDRQREQDILNNFFINKSESTLWIKGSRGLGKTTFFNYVFDQEIPYSLCYVNIKTESSAVDILSDFLLELQKECEMDFLSLIKTKYKKFYNGTYKNTKEITNMIFPEISTIASVLLDFGYIAITLNDEQTNSIEVINDYIRTILNNKKLCICIDNFSRCDLETASIFFQIFKTFFSKEYFRSCIITTSEDLQEDLRDAIYHNLPYTEIQINELDKYIYFSQILTPIFDLSAFETDDIKYLYKKCGGSPKKLATVISKLLEKNGITIYHSSRAKINKKALFCILQSEHIHFKEEDFNATKKWVIFSYLCLSEEVDYLEYEKLALFIAKKFFLFQSYDQQLFQKELLSLIDSHILKIKDNNKITIYYDDDYIELLDIFQNSQFKGMFSQYSYEFLLQQPDFPDKQKLLCRHAREANIIKWEQLNFRYGKLLSKKKQYYDAQKVFGLLTDYFNKLHVMQRLFIAINSYETGNFQLAINQLKTFGLEELHLGKARYYYLFYMGKSYNNIGQVKRGATALEKALLEVPVDSIEYVQTLNVLHMYYFEMPEKMEESMQIFLKIKNKYEKIYPLIWANTMRGCHNFLENEEALQILEQAEKLLEDELQKAFIKTTKGFIYIKDNKNELAKTEFEIACKTIKRLKIHEYSYAANNLAICLMLNKKYQQAKDILLEALFWNRTDYGNLVIQNHLMICSLYLGQENEAIEYYNYLQSYMNERIPQDPIMNRKIYLNLAIASKKMNMSIDGNNFLSKAEKYIKNTTSEWRYYMLMRQTDKCPIPRPTAKYQLIEDFEPWFLVYAHD